MKNVICKCESELKIFGLFVSVLVLYSSAVSQSVSNQGFVAETGRWLQIGDNSSMAIPVFTAECWIKGQTRIVIVSRDRPGNMQSDWSLVYDVAFRRLEFMTGTNSQPDEYWWTPMNSMKLDAWNHVAVVVNGTLGSVKIYINSVLSLSGNYKPRSFDVRSGLAWNGYFDGTTSANGRGLLDECRYWNHERSQAQIQACKDRRLAISERQGLNGYWSFCGNFADSSGTGNHLTPKGNPSIVDISDLPVGLSCGKFVAPITPIIITLGPTRFCAGDSVVLDAGYGYASYLWSTGETTQKIIVRKSGTLTVTVSDANGATGTSSPITVIVDPTPPKPVITKSNDTLFSSVDINLQWYLNGQPLAGATNRFHVMDRTGSYTVQVTNANGCSSLSDPIRFSTINVSTAFSLGCFDSLEYEPGQIVPIPLILNRSTNLALSGMTKLTAILRMRKNVLQPISHPSFTERFVGSERIVTLNIENTTNTTSGILYELPSIVMLGDTACTYIRLDSLYWTDGIATVDFMNTECALCVKTCKEGGTRLFSAEGKFFLKQNRPNPFNATTIIEYSIIEKGFTQLYILDGLGRKVAELVAGNLEPGKYSATFDASQLASGFYFYILRTPTRMYSNRMHLIK